MFAETHSSGDRVDDHSFYKIYSIVQDHRLKGSPTSDCVGFVLLDWKNGLCTLSSLLPVSPELYIKYARDSAIGCATLEDFCDVFRDPYINDISSIVVG